MEEAVSGNAALMRRILQLEQERDELRRDIEQLCMQQSGVSGSVDIFSRMQARRTAGLEQELEACKQKLAVCTRENHNLQEELSEVYHIKGQFADLLKVETEKNNGLEKEVKFFQVRVAAALAERDRAIVEVEKTHGKEQSMKVKMTQLRDRLEQITSDCLQQKKLCKDLQENLEGAKTKCEIYQKVVDFFWEMRRKVAGFDDVEGTEDRAATLLEESETSWVYGDTNKALEEAHGQAEKFEADLAMLQEEFQASIASVESLQRQLEEEYTSRRKAEDMALQHTGKLFHLAEVVVAELRKIQSIKATLKEDITALLKEEVKWAHSLSQTWGLISKGATAFEPAEKHEGRLQVMDSIEHELRAGLEKTDNIEASCSGAFDKNLHPVSSSFREDNQMQWDDSREVLARALSEKVATLLLLSQQEERHILEKNTSVALEYQISELKHQLSQVTSEKVKTLMELAQLRQEFKKLQERERELRHGTSASGRLLPALWADSEPLEGQKDLSVCDTYRDSKGKISSRGYLTHWLRGLELPGSKSSTLGRTCSAAKSKENDVVGIARLRVENATLQETLSSIRQLCNSASRLRLTIGKVAAESCPPNEYSVSTAVQVIDATIAEAEHLKVALGSSLPVSYSGWSSIDSPRAGTSEIVPEALDGEANEEPDLVSVFGMELVRLVLLAADLQKTFLTRQLNTEGLCNN